MSKYFKSNMHGRSTYSDSHQVSPQTVAQTLDGAPAERHLVDGYTQSDLDLFSELSRTHGSGSSSRVVTDRTRSRSTSSADQIHYTAQDQKQFDQLASLAASDGATGHTILNDFSGSELPAIAESSPRNNPLQIVEYENPLKNAENPTSSWNDSVSSKPFGVS